MTARVIFINICLHYLRISTIFQALCVNAILILDELIKSALSSKEDPWPKLSVCVWTFPPVQDCWYLTEVPGLGLQFVLSLSFHSVLLRLSHCVSGSDLHALGNLPSPWAPDFSEGLGFSSV